MLQRACVSPARGPGAAVEVQTLTMAMGLVAAMLGGAVQVRGQSWDARGVWGGGETGYSPAMLSRGVLQPVLWGLGAPWVGVPVHSQCVYVSVYIHTYILFFLRVVPGCWPRF